MPKHIFRPKRLKQSKIFNLKAIATVVTAIVFLVLILSPLFVPKPVLAQWSCGNPITDSRDDKAYNTVQIGTQCWFAEDLNVGTMTVGANEQNNDGLLEKYCYLDDAAGQCAADGALYQWAEAMALAYACNADNSCAGQIGSPHQGICPTGWHIPSDTEWHTLKSYLWDGVTGVCGASDTGWICSHAGDRLKIASKCHGGVDCADTGFESLLAGFRETNGSFYARGALAHVWSSLQNSTVAWKRSLHSGLATVYRATDNKLCGYSVRCLKDSAKITGFINVPENYSLYLESDGTDVTTNGQFGTHKVLLKSTTSAVRIADFNVNFENLTSWSDVHAGTDYDLKKAFIDFPDTPGHPEVTNKVLYVPASDPTPLGYVYICPGATSLESDQTNLNCSGVTTLNCTIGETKAGFTCSSEYTEFDGKKYYKITGISSTSGVEGQGADAEGDGEAVPEFTTLTFIIAAVAGFGIYLLIRKSKSKNPNNK